MDRSRQIPLKDHSKGEGYTKEEIAFLKGRWSEEDVDAVKAWIGGGAKEEERPECVAGLLPETPEEAHTSPIIYDMRGVHLWARLMDERTAEDPRITLSFAHLDHADLRMARLEHAVLGGAHLNHADLQEACLDHADLQEARLDHADLRMARLAHASLASAYLASARLEHAVLQGADLNKASLASAHLDDADLRGADLTDANLPSAILNLAHLEHARLFEANLEGADLRSIRKLRLDSNVVRNARFSPLARDPWSKLRRAYTGPKMVFNLLFLVAFLVPYVLKTAGWVALNQVQGEMAIAFEKLEGVVEGLEAEPHPAARPMKAAIEALSGRLPDDTRWALEGLSEAVAKLESEKHPAARPARAALEAVERRLPGEGKEGWSRYRVWQLVLGADRGMLQWLPATALLVYNVFRALLTWCVAGMRDEEERSGHCPRLRRDGRFGSPFEAYGWLAWPHRAVTVLLWFAILMFAYNAYTWLSPFVWVRTG